MTENIYRTLQKRLNKYSVGFPDTETGVELDILKKLFTEEDALLFLELTPMLETAETIAERLQRPVTEVTDQLEDMTKRGLLFCLKRGDSVKFGAIPFVHGLLEFQIKRLDRDMAELFEQYYHDGFKEAFMESSADFLRTIPVQDSIDVTQNIAAYDDACKILKSMETIVVTDCICRKQKKLIDKGCGKPLEACFMFGSMAQYYIDNNMGRRIDVDEAIRILEEAQEAGLVTQSATSQNPSGMCNCCGDCCGILGTLNTLSKPAEHVFSNHFAEVDEFACNGCEICTERCQMGAVMLNDEDIAEVNRDRCIGCGLCVTTCPSEAIRLVLKTGEEHHTPPANSLEQMMTMAKKRGIRF